MSLASLDETYKCACQCLDAIDTILLGTFYWPGPRDAPPSARQIEKVREGLRALQKARDAGVQALGKSAADFAEAHSRLPARPTAMAFGVEAGFWHELVLITLWHVHRELLDVDSEDVRGEHWEWVRTRAAPFANREELRHAKVMLGKEQIDVGTVLSRVATEKEEADGPWSEPDTPSRWARRYGISPATFKRHVKNGVIRAKTLSDRSYQVHLADLPSETVAPASHHK